MPRAPRLVPRQPLRPRPRPGRARRRRRLPHRARPSLRLPLSLLDPRRRWTDVPVHVLDFEGGARTGVVEYGVASLLGGAVVSLATARCAPLGPVPAEETRCHGLADQDLRGQRPLAARWEEFLALRASGILAAHQASVESRLLAATWPHPAAVPAVAETALAQADWGPWVDTLALARRRRPGLPDHALESLVHALGLGPRLAAEAERLCPPGRRRFHAAGYDALAAALVLLELAGPNPPSLASLLAESASAAGAARLGQGELPL